MAAEWKESFDKTRYSNQWEHIYAAGWKAAKAAEALKPSHNKQSTPFECCERCYYKQCLSCNDVASSFVQR